MHKALHKDALRTSFVLSVVLVEAMRWHATEQQRHPWNTRGSVIADGRIRSLTHILTNAQGQQGQIDAVVLLSETRV